MQEVDLGQLASSIEAQHGGHAVLREVVPVSEEFAGRPVWQGIVHVFDLEGHPSATRAYASSSPVEGSDKRRFVAVLHVPPIRSAADAVQAAIVAEHRARK